MTAITHAISAALLHFVWQGPLAAFLLWAALAIFRNGPARLRYALSCAALAIMAALPIVTGWIVYQAPTAASARMKEVADISYSAGPGALSAAASLSRWIAALEAWALPVWFAGVLICALRLIWSSRYAGRLRREGDPAEASIIDTVSGLARRMNIGRPVRVLISQLTDSPSVVGWLRPVVLLPTATLLNLSVEQLEAVLAHELAHVRRHDYLVNLLQTLAETLFFYQPAVWWVSSRIRRERELCCDDAAVEACGDATGYARALSKLERLRATPPALAMSSTGGPLLYRIQRLTGGSEKQRPSKLAALLGLCVALLCFMTNLHWAYAQPKPGQEEVVQRNAIWMDTVKYGDLPIQVRALGTVTAPNTVELNVPDSQAMLVRNGQSASIEVRRGVMIAGAVASRGTSAADGTVPVVVELQASVPEFVNQASDGIIRIKTMDDVIYVGRPVGVPSTGESTLFRL